MVLLIYFVTPVQNVTKFVQTNVKKLVGVLILFLALVKGMASHDDEHLFWLKNVHSARQEIDSKIAFLVLRLRQRSPQ